LKSYFNNAPTDLHIAVLVPVGGKEQKAYHAGFVQIETVVENQSKKFFSLRSTSKTIIEKKEKTGDTKQAGKVSAFQDGSALLKHNNVYKK